MLLLLALPLLVAAQPVTVQVPLTAQELQTVLAAWRLPDQAALQAHWQTHLRTRVERVLSEAAGIPPPAPTPVQAPSTPMLSVAWPLLLLGWGWETAGWLLHLLGVWALAYLCWEARPMRRLLFGVVKRLYPRSLEE